MVEALEAALNVLQAVGASNEVGKVLAALAAARKGQGEGHNVRGNAHLTAAQEVEDEQ